MCLLTSTLIFFSSSLPDVVPMALSHQACQWMWILLPSEFGKSWMVPASMDVSAIYISTMNYKTLLRLRWNQELFLVVNLAASSIACMAFANPTLLMDQFVTVSQAGLGPIVTSPLPTLARDTSKYECYNSFLLHLGNTIFCGGPTCGRANVEQWEHS